METIGRVVSHIYGGDGYGTILRQVCDNHIARASKNCMQQALKKGNG